MYIYLAGLADTYFDLGLQASNSQSAIELLLTRPELLTSLRKAHMGNYGIILSLLGCLEHGLKAKKLVDTVIDSCRCYTSLRNRAGTEADTHQAIKSRTCVKISSCTAYDTH